MFINISNKRNAADLFRCCLKNNTKPKLIINDDESVDLILCFAVGQLLLLKNTG